MSFAGKVVVVTGGARGIGKAIAQRFHQGGASVAVMDVMLDAAKETASELSASGPKCSAYACDVSKSVEADAVVETVLKDFGKIDVLVNNAGITRDGLAMRMTDEAWDAVININLSGAFKMLRAVARPMMKARSGAIVNIASVVGIIGNPGQANYCAAKAGMICLTKSAAREFASRGIRVNAVAPGVIDTHMVAKLNDEQRKALVQDVPLERMGTPEDVAKAVCFLASDEASYITGEVIRVTGGLGM
jgi:3-oxoacyl-[acyl-carrier protein] reductase